MLSNEEYYRHNTAYSAMLEEQPDENFRKYADVLAGLASARREPTRVLDVGCGTGKALEQMPGEGMERRGLELSEASAAICRRKGFACDVFEGRTMPYPDEHFHIVGSYNVLEHTDDPMQFLAEQLRVLQTGGHLAVVCPNFLAISNGFHHHTRGPLQKLRNVASMVSRVSERDAMFQKMATVSRADFKPDDDACNVTNPLDILRWGRRRWLTVVYWSSLSTYQEGFRARLDHGPLRYLLGSSFIVFRKTQEACRDCSEQRHTASRSQNS